MKKKVTWVVVSGWMVAALLLTSCAPAVVEEQPEQVAPKQEVPKEKVVPKEVVVPKEEASMVKWTGTKLDGTVVERMIEKPRYGGIHITTGQVQPTTFDDVTYHGGINWAVGPVNETLWLSDWARGPLTTNEWSPQLMVIPSPGTTYIGLLVESWEYQKPDTIIFHIRQGIHWALDPTSEASRLVGGREFTAADVVHSTVRNFRIGYPKKAYKYLSDMKNPENSIYVSPDDPWAVVLKTIPGMPGMLIRQLTKGRNKMFAPEVTEKYGEINEWKNVVGTGPFILKDYVTASSLTYERNPNYWRYDPIFPENQLPYVDGFVHLIIPDMSTQLAALRAGKIDHLPTDGTGRTLRITKDMAQSLMKTHPDLEWLRYYGGGTGLRLAMRTDTKPFEDVRVRQALQMAINNQELKDDFYGGEAEIFTYPVQPIPENANIYTPLEEMPQSVRELYEYHPDKARQLLAEAGYPDGFETSIITQAPDVDLLSVIQNYWADIGVDLEIQVRSSSTYTSLRKKKTYEQMFTTTAGGGFGMIFSSYQRKGGGSNYSIVNDPWHNVQWETLIANYFDMAKRDAVYNEPLGEGLPNWKVYTNEQSWYIDLPVPYVYLFWQPWLKGHGGVLITGHSGGLGWTSYVWLDQEMKKAMGY